MTPSSHVAPSEQPLSLASERMRRLGLRHLPIVSDGKLCGVLSERDVERAESLALPQLAHLDVGAAMGSELYPVAQSTPLAQVVRTMAAHGYACAIVVEREVVVGVFAASDACRVLSTLLADQSGEREKLGASEARAVVMAEQAHVDALLSRTDRALQRLQRSHDPEGDAHALREQARHLCGAMGAYFELRERELTPVLSELTGSTQSWVEQLAQEHVLQVADLAALAGVLGALDQTPFSLADAVAALLSNLRRDLERERALLRSLDDVSNDEVISDAAAD